eukprot:1877371-Rhodomonas_salina.1
MPEGIAAYEGELVRLVRSIYGTLQLEAVHNWQKELVQHLLVFGMHAAVDEDTVFVFHSEIGTIICVTFVDDII